MKYLPLRELDLISNALNFRTPDCRVVGACDLYTIKAAGRDKKLYKTIDQSLESQHESLVRLAESFTPPADSTLSVNLNRSSAFGNLGKVSSRRTFAYLIATLNASHPDYDFSDLARTMDFIREVSLSKVMANVDETLFNLRPRPTGALLALPLNSSYQGLPNTPGGNTYWSPRMWKNVDAEMALRECEIYRYSPEEDPFDADDSAIWSVNYFFFNKERRRVMYIHFRGLSACKQYGKALATHSASYGTRTQPASRSLSFGKTGAGKRAKYWLGDKADRCESEPVWGEDYDYGEDFVISRPGDDDAMDVEDEDEEGEFASDGGIGGDEEEEDDDDGDEEMDDLFRNRLSRSPVRAVSESIAEQMEV